MLGVHIPLLGDLRLGPPFSTTVTMDLSLHDAPFPFSSDSPLRKIISNPPDGGGVGVGISEKTYPQLNTDGQG